MRSCRRWQLFVLQLVLRGDLSLGMHPEFRDPRRSHVAPVVWWSGSRMSLGFSVRVIRLKTIDPVQMRLRQSHNGQETELNKQDDKSILKY